MSETTQTSAAKKRAVVLALAAALAVPFEGIRQYAYYDPPGILTVCYGSTTDVEKGKKYSLEECRARLNTDMLTAVDIVTNCTKNITLTVNQHVAFADMVYNIGPTPVCSASKSTLARYLSADDVVAACNQIPRWDKARVGGVMVSLPGLTKRRAAEKELCLKPDTL